ncbi:unnamed protein product [Prunus armeniaca]
MAMKVLAMLVVMMAVVQDSRAAVNKNGEPTGWTTIDNIDYKKWPATRTFHGDIITWYLRLDNSFDYTRYVEERNEGQLPNLFKLKVEDGLVTKETGEQYTPLWTLPRS